MQHGAALTPESGEPALAEAVASGAWQQLPPRLRALLAYALKLTRTPGAMTEADVDALRAAGLDDRAIVDANQVVAYFNYVNRVADGLGVELEASWPDELRRRRGYPLAAAPAWPPLVRAEELPWLSVEQMREVDRLMTDELGIGLEQMMENAGRSLAVLARRLLAGDAAERRVLVLAGRGGNGGGGMVAARHLAAAGAQVELRLSGPPEQLAPVPARQHEILRRLGIPVTVGDGELGERELVVDALLGYSQAGAARGAAAALIERCAGRRVLALDVPSGLELATGTLHRPHVRAEATLTLALPKQGLRASGAVGELFLADISVPAAVYARLGVDYSSPFGSSPIVRVRLGETEDR